MEMKFVRRSLMEDFGEKAGYLFSQETGYVYELNETGMFIWNLLKNHTNIDEILNEILRKYNISKKRAKEDLEEFLKKLIEYGLVEVEDDKCSSDRP
jgi:hypothetical protein